MKLTSLEATVELSTGTLASLTLHNNGSSYVCGAMSSLTRVEEREAGDCLRALLAHKDNGGQHA